MLMPYLFTAAGLVLLAVFCVKRVKATTPGVAMIKAMVSVCFITAALSATASKGFDFAHIRYAVFIIIGLIFGLLGDIALDLKFAHRRESKTYTYAGFISFLVGHLCYDAGMISEFYIKGNALYLIIPAAVCLLTAFVIRFSEKPLKVEYGEYKNIVTLYTPVLVSLVAISFSMAMLNGWKVIGLDVISGGSIFFLVSDFILSGTYFGSGKSRPVDIVTNHVTYYIAQFAIALSLCFISR